MPTRSFSRLLCPILCAYFPYGLRGKEREEDPVRLHVLRSTYSLRLLRLLHTYVYTTGLRKAADKIEGRVVEKCVGFNTQTVYDCHNV